LPTNTYTRCPGLVTAPNSESSGPGALKQLVNGVLRRADLIEKRRPVRQYTTTASFATAVSANAVFGYNKHLFVVDSNAASRWYMDDGTNTGTLTPLTPLPAGVSNVPFGQYTTAEMNGSAYIPFAGQMLKIDALGTVPYLAGLPKSSYMVVSGVVGNSAGWYTLNASVAYRVIFGFQDANGTLVLGAPSSRFVATNASAVGYPNLFIAIPTEIINSAKLTTVFMQLYRTNMMAAGGDPGDDMALVYQAFLTSADGAAGYRQVVDVFPETVNKGPALYTNASQQGIANANTQPPLCTDIAQFKNTMFYGNTTSKHRSSLTIAGPPPEWAISSVAANTPIAGQSRYTFSGSPDLTGVDTTMVLAVQGTASANDRVGGVGWTILAVDNAAKTITVSTAGAATGAVGTAMAAKLTVGGRSYSAIYLSDINQPTGSFGFSTSFGVPVTGTASQRISFMAASISACVSFYDTPQTAVYAGVVSGPDDSPGMLLFEERGIGGAAFTVAASGTGFQASFVPALFTAQTSKNDKAINRVYYSKFAQPEHVPLANYFDIGGKTAAVLRIVPLRDSLFVFKEDGIFRITGDGQNWNVARFDDTLILVHANAIAVIFNTIYAYTNKGIVAITDNGVRLASEQISNLTRNFTDGPVAPTVYTHTSEKDGLVYFAITQGTARLGVCYSYKTNAWAQIDLTPQGSGNVQLMGGPGLAVGGVAYRLNTDQVYAEAVVDPTENPALGTIKAAAPVPNDRYRLTISAVNAGASQITATLNTTCKAPAVGDLVMENVGAIGVTGLWAITAIAGNVLTLSSLTTAGAVGTQAGFQFAAGGTYLYAPLTMTVEYQPLTIGDDHAIKRFVAASVLLDSVSTANLATVSFYTEIAKTQFDQVTTATAVLELRTLIPLPMQRSRRLSMLVSHSAPGQHLFIKGISVDSQPYVDGRSIE
jgi:hypothetical protein